MTILYRLLGIICILAGLGWLRYWSNMRIDANFRRARRRKDWWGRFARTQVDVMWRQIYGLPAAGLMLVGVGLLDVSRQVVILALFVLVGLSLVIVWRNR